MQPLKSEPLNHDTHLVKVDLSKLLQVLVRIGLLAKVVKEVSIPLVGGDRRVGKGLDVVLHVGDKVLKTANSALEVEEEVGTLLSAVEHDVRYLLIWDLAVCLIGCGQSSTTADSRSSCSL